MRSVRELPWPRIVAESVVIVASILLAFAIDAWWQNRGERSQERELLLDLKRDFEASQAHLDDWLAGNRRVQQGTTRFLDALQAQALGDSFEVPLEWLVAAIGTPTYSPTDATLVAAAASGRLDLLRDEDLRQALAEWRQQFEDTAEDELLVRELVTHHLVELLGQQARLAIPFEPELHTGWFAGVRDLGGEPAQSLRASLELEARLGQRVFYHGFVVSGLENIRQTQAHILDLLEANLAE